MAETMNITWLGHSCFRVESRGYTAVLDPYADGSVEGLLPVRETADLVLCSHEHGDHNARDLVTLREGKAPVFRVETISTYHDDQKGAKRGPNTIHILDDGVFRAAHAGDLGCALSGEELEKLKGLDVLMVPVGGYYTIDAAQARALVNAVKPRIVIPMHYRGEGFGFDVLAELEDFTRLCGDVVHYGGSVLELTKDLPAQTAVLKPLLARR